MKSLEVKFHCSTVPLFHCSCDFFFWPGSVERIQISDPLTYNSARRSAITAPPPYDSQTAVPGYLGTELATYLPPNYLFSPEFDDVLAPTGASSAVGPPPETPPPTYGWTQQMDAPPPSYASAIQY